ncbi:hypothetical protein [Streptomyces yangpuensis]|uniref:hypothetical protein n=1 Tax=Streptomyces yangpuensis TaxID=1648182 RepID=UPI0036648853
MPAAPAPGRAASATARDHRPGPGSPGEGPAGPSAPLLDGIAVCLVDVSDEVRHGRLTLRDPGRWDAAAVAAFLGRAARHCWTR